MPTVPATVQNPIAGMDLKTLIGIRDGIWSMLPAGNFRNALKKAGSGSLLDALSFIPNLIKGPKYTAGERRLGERFNDNVIGGKDMGYRDVPDEMVEAAQNFFTGVFGVRITNDEDMWALDYSPELYYSRPDKADVPRAAVERAVALKKMYYPASTYNNSVWDLQYFGKYPLVAPIPGLQQGTLYNGLLPGGGQVQNGIIVVEDKIVAQDPDKVPGAVDTGGLSTSIGGMSSAVMIYVVIGVIVLITIILLFRHK